MPIFLRLPSGKIINLSQVHIIDILSTGVPGKNDYVIRFADRAEILLEKDYSFLIDKISNSEFLFK